MTDELKACPFCKAMLTFPIKESPWGEIYLCQGCSTRFVVSAERYNTRPLEDALHKQLVSRNALVKRLVDALEEIMDGFEIRGDAKLDALVSEGKAAI